MFRRWKARPRSATMIKKNLRYISKSYRSNLFSRPLYARLYSIASSPTPNATQCIAEIRSPSHPPTPPDPVCHQALPPSPHPIRSHQQIHSTPSPRQSESETPLQATRSSPRSHWPRHPIPPDTPSPPQRGSIETVAPSIYCLHRRRTH